MSKQDVLLWDPNDELLLKVGLVSYEKLVDYAKGNSLFIFYNKKSLTKIGNVNRLGDLYSIVSISSRSHQRKFRTSDLFDNHNTKSTES